MGLSQGAFSYRTYYVNGEPPKDYRQLYMEQIRLHHFRPLTPEGEEDISVGWVPIENILETEFDAEMLFPAPYLVATLRLDRWAIPAALLKAMVKQEEKIILTEQNREHFTRLEREETLQHVRARLKTKTLPSIRAIDFFWNLDQGLVRFGSTAGGSNEQFIDLFERTFELTLVPDSPYIGALNCGLDEELIGQLADVAPASFIGVNDGSN